MVTASALVKGLWPSAPSCSGGLIEECEAKLENPYMRNPKLLIFVGFACWWVPQMTSRWPVIISMFRALIGEL